MANHKEGLIELAKKKTEHFSAEVKSDPYRLAFHLMPPVGLLNDPNGLVYFKGQYHVFFQWNPFDTAHGAKFWGHYTSPDLLNWKEEVPALAPEEWYDRNGCYSGSAAVSDEKLYLFYTGNVKSEDGTRESHQCLAVSDDGIHFEKYGPVLEVPPGYTTHFRDPKVWREGERWYMVVGAQTAEEKGAAVLFASDDLYHWDLAGPIAGAGMNGLGEFGYMWECPDFIRLNGRELLLVSPQGLEAQGHLYNNIFQSGYFAGTLDYDKARFQHGPFIELDRGFDFYAPQTFRDPKGRTILFGWMGITDEAEASQPTVKSHWVHALTIPRELKEKDGRILQIPPEELEGLRRNRRECGQIALSAFKGGLEEAVSRESEIMLDSIESGRKGFEIHFRDEAVLQYDPEAESIRLVRRNWKTDKPETRVCMLNQGLNRLRIYMDTSSLEIFVNDGEEVFTSRFFPSPEAGTIRLIGDAAFTLSIWDLGLTL